MRLRVDGGAIVRNGLLLLTLYATTLAVAMAVKTDDMSGVTRAVLVVAVLALADYVPWLPAGGREAAFIALRGGVVTALTLAPLEFGPTTGQVERAGHAVVAALLLGFLVLLGQARRAAEGHDERRRATQSLASMEMRLDGVAAGLQSPAPSTPVPTALPAALPALVGVAVAAASLGWLAGRRTVARTPRCMEPWRVPSRPGR